MSDRLTLWLDAQLPPQLAHWLTDTFGTTENIEAIALRTLGLRDATDREIYTRAKTAGVVVVSKDSDFVDLVQRLGTPPQLLWVTCGNMSNARLQDVFEKTLPQALSLFREGRSVVEIGDR